MSASASCRVCPLSSSTKARPATPRSVAISSASPNGRGVEAVGHLQALAAALVVAGRHGLVRDEQVVQPAAARQADLVGGIEHAGRAFEQAARVVDGDGLHELLGAQPAPALEQLLAVRRAQAQVLGQPIQRGLLGPGLGQEGDGAADELVVARAVGAERGGGVGGRWLCVAWVVLAVTSGGDPDLGRAGARIRPVSCGAAFKCARRPGRPAAPPSARTAKSRRSSSVRKRPKASSLPCDDDPELRAPVRPFAQVHARPIGVAVELLVPARGVHAGPGEPGRRRARRSRTGARSDS